MNGGAPGNRSPYISNESYKAYTKRFKQKFTTLRNEEKEMAGRFFEDGTLYCDYLFFASSVDKCMRLIDGEVLMLESRNLPCAEALLRMQIDICMRVFAAFIAADREEFFDSYLHQKSIRKLKDKHGIEMHDGYLKEKLGEYDRELPNVYNTTSGSVHFSTDATIMMGQPVDEPNSLYNVRLNIGCEPDERWNSSLVECCVAFEHYVCLHLELLSKTIPQATDELSKH